ncbi:LysR substrate-binding domain-containing protein [Streptomyces sp. 5112.2]|uniref:LysR substrate-binding domain-containing protein n=1 Tax=unclassified Streptomyces TaxID=2593676 RepID=UPI0027D8A2C1|nr:LysR substrate-binding domain-containing protein [Streptomyces sp. 5112.2]
MTTTATASRTAGHPLLAGELTPERFAGAAGHLIVSRRGRLQGPIDDALAELGLQRRVVGSVGSSPASLFVVQETDLIGLVSHWGRHLADTLGLVTFEIPLRLPAVKLGFAWHPRHDADRAHAWLRGCVRELMLRESAG